MSQSAVGELPGSASILTLPSPDRARTAASLPLTVTLPSPVCTSSSPFTWRALMLPSPDVSCRWPLTPSRSIEPSPLRAETSAVAGTDTIRRADREKLNLNPCDEGTRASTVIRLPSCSA